MKNVVIIYAPALHEGYIKFLRSHKDDVVYVVSDEIRSLISTDLPYYGRDVRAVSSTVMKNVIRSLEVVEAVHELDGRSVDELRKAEIKITMPDEDISHEIAQRFFSEREIQFEPVFLRWDKKISEKEFEVSPDRVITKDGLARELMSRAFKEAEKSPDWWRRIGVVVTRNGNTLLAAHNTHMPEKDNVHVLGDPRSNFDAGVSIDITSAIHGEAALIAEAARQGITLDGTTMYATTFPCPNCAKLIAKAGIKKIFYAKGYSLLDAEDILKANGVEIVMVDMES